MKVIVFGATGMAGAGVLIEWLGDSRVHSVLVIGRHSVGISNPKLRELIRSDFLVTTTENVGRAMIEVAAVGYSRRVLENSDINLLAARTG
jgi:nucleoside-diphosphate-sugar epimerase